MKKSKKKYIAAVNALLTEVIAVTACFIIIFSFVIGIHVQRGNSMDPAIKDGDILIYLRVGRILNTAAVVYEDGGRVQSGRIEEVKERKDVKGRVITLIRRRQI